MSEQQIHILVADKNQSKVASIRNTLSRFNDIHYSIETADSVKKMISKTKKDSFDLMLLSQSLPGIRKGRDLEKIGKRDQLKVPFIMVVDEGAENIGVRAMDYGAYDYITNEEISTVALNRAVMRALQRRKLEDHVKESVTRLEKMVIRDGLTGLYNHNHFKEVLGNEYKKTKRNHQPMSCIMIDLDHFKDVNDSYGHQFGDYVLVQSSEILKKLVRDTDFVARYGGEEFFIILPSTTLKGAYILAERIRIAFANNVFKKDEVSENITVSMGISTTSDGNVISDNELIANADKALYHAKWRGRNNVCTFEETEVEEDANIREEVERIDRFHSQLKLINEGIKKNCIESAHNILREIEDGWDYISKHSVRVSSFTAILTKELKMSVEDMAVVKRAALLHDIGMIGVSSNILRKKSKLTNAEYNIVKRHANIGVKIMEMTNLFDKELPIILYHHERYDGKGYPHKLKKETIPYGARILAIADAYYKKPGSAKKAIAELKKCSGTQFDPHMVDAFTRVVQKSSKA
jgi:diguanylate cyclase (GGDEF)-like protein/putative nucleotidyltransferase with HDIG domain